VSAATAADLGRLRRRGFRLEYASIAWMIAEAGVAITAGIGAGSIALTGFGLDSLIELASALIVIWQLRGEVLGKDRDTRAVRLVGVTFFALAAYLTAESIYDLVSGGPSPPPPCWSRLPWPSPRGAPAAPWAAAPWWPTRPRPRSAPTPPPPPSSASSSIPGPDGGKPTRSPPWS
jgi:hypothetical protein